MAKFKSNKQAILSRAKPIEKLSKVKIVTPHDIIKYGLKTEAASRLIEANNTLVFICCSKATKIQIKEAFKAIYGVEAMKVNTLNTMKGTKKAYIRCKEDGAAIEVMTNAQIF